jgi:hypothetical protein
VLPAVVVLIICLGIEGCRRPAAGDALDDAGEDPPCTCERRHQNDCAVFLRPSQAGWKQDSHQKSSPPAAQGYASHKWPSARRTCRAAAPPRPPLLATTSAQIAFCAREERSLITLASLMVGLPDKRELGSAANGEFTP